MPRAILQQKSSPINVPLIWSATGTDETTPVFDWLMGEASRVPDQVQFHDGHTDVCNAVREGWIALREMMRMWEIEDRSDLSEWLGRRGFPRTTAGNHISARVKEVILSEEQSKIQRLFSQFPGEQGKLTSQRSLDLSEVFLERIPMLKTCPRFLRGRLRFSFAIALRELYRAKLEGDMVGANRAWTLFLFGSHFGVEQASTHWVCRAGRAAKES